MRVAISNIAWRADEDLAAYDLLDDLGVPGIEVAPTRLWADPWTLSPVAVAERRSVFAERGFSVVALQSLLFGKPDLRLFAGAAQREALFTHLTAVIETAAGLGAGVLVFGSPSNRALGSLTWEEGLSIAVPFFRRVGRAAAARGVCFCIEPNAAAYGCDFVRDTSEGIELVAAVADPGFGLHLDGGVLTMNGEAIEDALATALPHLSHLHISEPNLAPVGSGETDHRRIAAALRTLGYQGWTSIEMRAAAPVGESNLPAVRAALELALATYGG